MHFKKEVILGIALLIILSTSVLAHHPEETTTKNNEHYSSKALTYIIYTTAIMFALTAIALIDKNMHNTAKKIVYWTMVLVIILATAYSAISTLYINTRSESKGPVHWHTDFEVWVCGEKIDLKNPRGLNNRIGTPILHEHGDDRIHIEGVLEHLEDGSLTNFFHVIGGELGKNSITIPTNKATISMTNGEQCPNGQPGTVQVYRYYITNPETKPWHYQQEKLEDYENYRPAPYSYVPPADCIIITYGQEQPTTNKLCESYQVAEQKGEIYGS